MTESTFSPDWGVHLNETVHSLHCTPCPEWATSWDKEKWHKLGVVVWDARLSQVIHLYGSQAARILEQALQSELWKSEGLLVGEIVYRITIPSDKKSKNKIADQSKSKPSQENGWCLTNMLLLEPDRAKRFIAFLERNQETLKKVVAAETAERRRILGQVYSLILSWRDKRKKGDSNATTSTVQETKSISSDAVAIPHGKYFTITQVAEICGVEKKTISAWLKKGILKGLNLPGLGQIVEEKELKRYMTKTKIVDGGVY